MKSLCDIHSRFAFRCALGAAILSILLVIPTALLAWDDDNDSLVYPPESAIYGMTYGDWLAAFFQYEFSFPVDNSPVFDNTGALCNLGQSGGPVFFLNSSVVPGVPITRTCTIPYGKALYIPNVGAECSNLEGAPFHGGNGPELRACVGTFTDGIDRKSMKITVDHKKINNLQAYRAQTPVYNFIMPPDNNILGLPGVTSGFSVADLYAVMLRPLPPGFHVIHFEGGWNSGPGAGMWFSVTYYLTVQ